MTEQEGLPVLNWQAARFWRLGFGSFWDESVPVPVVTRSERKPGTYHGERIDVSYKVEWVQVDHEIIGVDTLPSNMWKVTVRFWVHKLKRDGGLAANVNSGYMALDPERALSMDLPIHIRQFIEAYRYPTSTLRLIERSHGVD